MVNVGEAKLPRWVRAWGWWIVLLAYLGTGLGRTRSGSKMSIWRAKHTVGTAPKDVWTTGQKGIPGTVFRDTFPDGSEGPEMVVIPAGEFWMGSDKARDPEAEDDELPRHRVRMSEPFAVGRYSVTFEEYDRFVGASGRNRPENEDWGRGRRPVVNVSWDDAVAYAKWLSGQTGKRYRLPTEAE